MSECIYDPMDLYGISQDELDQILADSDERYRQMQQQQQQQCFSSSDSQSGEQQSQHSNNGENIESTLTGNTGLSDPFRQLVDIPQSLVQRYAALGIDTDGHLCDWHWQCLEWMQRPQLQHENLVITTEGTDVGKEIIVEGIYRIILFYISLFYFVNCKYWLLQQVCVCVCVR